MEWLPIETAPRDGTHILLQRANGNPEYAGAGKRYLGKNVAECFVAFWFPEPAIFGPKCPRWVTPHEGAAPWTDKDFTHWMPLPAPPTNTNNRGEG